MPRKNSTTKPVHSFRLSPKCVRQLKDMAGTMGRCEGNVVEISIDRMYREEMGFGNLMIGEGGKPENNYKAGNQEEQKMIARFFHFIWKISWNMIIILVSVGLIFIGYKANQPMRVTGAPAGMTCGKFIQDRLDAAKTI